MTGNTRSAKLPRRVTLKEIETFLRKDLGQGCGIQVEGDKIIYTFQAGKVSFRRESDGVVHAKASSRPYQSSMAYSSFEKLIEELQHL